MASSYLCFWKSSWFLFNREVCHAAKFQPNAWHAGFTLGQLCLCFLLWQSQCVLRCVKLGSNAGVLVPLIFFKELFNLGSLMPEYQHILSKIFKLIWLIVHLQHRGKMSQRFYFSYLNYCPTIRSKGKLTCFLKKKKRCNIPFALPLAPEVLPLPSCWLFLEASVFFSRPATKDVLCCYWGLCVWLTLELFLESATTICIELVELHFTRPSQRTVCFYMDLSLLQITFH